MNEEGVPKREPRVTSITAELERAGRVGIDQNPGSLSLASKKAEMWD